MPTFLFQINEIREHKDVDPTSDSYGYWIPSHNPGFNVIAHGEGATGVWWMCNGDTIWSLNDSQLPPNKRHYKTFSVFYSDGLGFRVLHGNANNPTAGEVWHPLGFEHDREDGYASFLTNAMQNPTLHRHRRNQDWPRMLLPDIYHGPVSTSATRGALKGELPIFLALLALSMEPNQILTHLPLMLQGGAWQVHGMNGRTHKRGVMVSVYSCPTWVGATAADIEGLEEGRHGQKYYY